MPKVNMRVELIKCTAGAEEIVAMGAKLCYSGADIGDLKQGIEARDQSAFIKKLVDMGHYSPLEHAVFTFGVEGVSRALLAQVTRHRIASFSVQSQRYVKKDSSTFNYIVPPAISALGEKAEAEYARQMETMLGWYLKWSERLGAGERGNEDARFVLPNATETKMLITMNARELLHFFSLRCCRRAQWEIREMAWRMLALCLAEAPAIFSAAGPSCVAGACSEGKMSCGNAAKVRGAAKSLFEGVSAGVRGDELERLILEAVRTGAK